ncbi:Cupin 2 conserved barrel domain protein [Clostridium carboxidivorans P7]|uniref:Cupin 2 conserved barrel domain protein n=2 Tax=Clostridium TaxID=1485 RepID=C6PT38_9CLOT|nr:PocR ligand-binding domain-containing protein [Clostridium carboxidivorans]EET87559.1 Cupin 2 conserved barrel domain protein [Clostridium carboxidivorans P7]EFG87325.1 cupin domain protein [Clostridium carboxidivorans P7]
MKKNKYDIQKFEWGEVTWLHEPSNLLTQRLSAGLVKFFPGKKQTRHVHFGEEQILYVIKGQGIHRINGEEKKLESGMLIHCPPYSEHEVINTSQEELVFLITYTPSKLMEIHQNLSIVNDKHILDIVDIEVLENIQKEVSELLKLSVVITDNNNNDITKPINLNKFCSLCKSTGLCKEKESKYESELNKQDKVFECCNNIITIIVPILMGDKIIGYVKCGHLIINKSKDTEKLILESCKNTNINCEELIAAYNDIPLIPKSRLYALQESLGIVSKLISNIIENSLVEKELSEKNNEILKNTKEKVYLEDALKQANLKLLKSQVSSSIQNYNFQSKSYFYTETMEYPISEEEKLKDYIKKLDESACHNMILQIITKYEGLSIEEIKENCEELLIILSRIVYSETNDKDMFLDIRYKYKKKIKNCIDYNNLKDIILEACEEIINILKKYY